MSDSPIGNSDGKYVVLAAILSCLLALLGLLASAPVAEDHEPTPEDAVVGQVVLVEEGDLSLSGYPGMVGTTVLDGNTLVTGNSAAVVALVEGTMLYLGSNSQAQIVLDGDGFSVLKRIGRVLRTGDPGSEEMDRAIVKLAKRGRGNSKGDPPTPSDEDDDT